MLLANRWFRCIILPFWIIPNVQDSFFCQNSQSNFNKMFLTKTTIEGKTTLGKFNNFFFSENVDFSFLWIKWDVMWLNKIDTKFNKFNLTRQLSYSSYKLNSVRKNYNR